MRLNIVKKRYAPIPPYDCEIVEIDIQSVPYVLHGLWLKYQKYFWYFNQRPCSTYGTDCMSISTISQSYGGIGAYRFLTMFSLIIPYHQQRILAETGPVLPSPTTTGETIERH